MRSFLFLTMLAMTLLLGGCASSGKKSGAPLTKADSLAIAEAVARQAARVGGVAVDSAALAKKKYPQNLDVAHESYLRAMDMELRGEKQLAEVFWQRAYEADPGNRYLAFGMANRLLAQGNDSAALNLAKEAIQLKGKISSDQYDLMAKLYVRAGIADSARKYFVIALDSSHYQDMSMLYDYSLFLEAVHDEKELVRVYDLLLPQVNYIQSLFSRQLNLLLKQEKDSAIVELFGKAHDATGDKDLLAKMVQGLVLQKRYAEARKIADTLSTTTEHDEAIINTVLLSYSELDQEEGLKFLKKKVYEDGLRSPVILYYLGSYEYSAGEKDSAKVHLSEVYLKLDKTPAYGAQACRALAGLHFAEKKNKEGVRYAELADSLLHGADKDFLATAYGYAGMYERAYTLLDSMLGVWSNWKPMDGIADAETIEMLNKKAVRSHRQLQNTYARVLITEAREIEDKHYGDTLKLAKAIELRTKAELFWESMLMADSTDFFVRFSMAMNLERMGRYDESFAMFEKLLSTPARPGLDKSEIMNYYGYSMIDRNRSREEVEKGFQLVLKALELDGQNEAYLDSKAWGLYRLQRYEEAYAVMELIKSPRFQEDEEYWEHMGAIQAALGKTADATKSYKKLLKLRPGHPVAKEFLGKKK